MMKILLMAFILSAAGFCQINDSDFVVVTFDDQGLNANQSVGTMFESNGLIFEAGRNIFTNYGFDLDYNSNGIFYLFDKSTEDSINIKPANGSPVDVLSLDAYQVGENSSKDFVINGWRNSVLKYSKSFSSVYSWQTLPLNFEGVDDLSLSVAKGDPRSVDYNIDNIVYRPVAADPVVGAWITDSFFPEMNDSTSVVLIEFWQSMDAGIILNINNYSLRSGSINYKIYGIAILDSLEYADPVKKNSLVALFTERLQPKTEYFAKYSGTDYWFYFNGFLSNKISKPKGISIGKN